MSQVRFVTLDQAKAIHVQHLALFGGATGFIDEGSLESALYRPTNIANYNQGANLYELAAALSYAIAINHPFVDGNKRTAFIVMAVFLEINGVSLIATEVEVVKIMLGVAKSEVSETDLTAWLQINCQ